MRNPTRIIARSVRNRGIIKTLLHVPRAVLSRLPAAERERQEDLAADREIDQRYGIDTAGNIDSLHLKTDSPNKGFSARYQPIRPEHFTTGMSLVPTRLDGFTFIDVGSGKGRALMLAADYPFERIIGVEFCPDLHEIAVKNVARVRGVRKKCPAIEPLCADALTYEFPAAPTVLFLYNPFDAQVMAPFVRQLEESLALHPRELYVSYCKPECARLFDDSPAFRRVAKRGEMVIIYKADLHV